MYFTPILQLTQKVVTWIHIHLQKIDRFAEANPTIIGVTTDNNHRLNTFSSNLDYCAGKFPATLPIWSGKSWLCMTLKANNSKGMKNEKGEETNQGFIHRITFEISKDRKTIAVFSSQNDKIFPVDYVKKSLEMVQNI